MRWAPLVAIPFDFHSSTRHPVNIVVQWLYKTDVHGWPSLGYTENPVVQLIILSMFIFCNRTSARARSLVPFTVLRFCLRARDRSQRAQWLWGAPNILSWAIATETVRKFLRTTPQASSEYFWRRCQRSLSFLLTPYTRKLDLSFCFKCHRFLRGRVLTPPPPLLTPLCGIQMG